MAISSKVVIQQLQLETDFSEESLKRDRETLRSLGEGGEIPAVIMDDLASLVETIGDASASLRMLVVDGKLSLDFTLNGGVKEDSPVLELTPMEEKRIRHAVRGGHGQIVFDYICREYKGGNRELSATEMYHSLGVTKEKLFSCLEHFRETGLIKMNMEQKSSISPTKLGLQIIGDKTFIDIKKPTPEEVEKFLREEWSKAHTEVFKNILENGNSWIEVSSVAQRLGFKYSLVASQTGRLLSMGLIERRYTAEDVLEVRPVANASTAWKKVLASPPEQAPAKKSKVLPAQSSRVYRGPDKGGPDRMS